MKELTKEEILAKARIDYPIGTKFKLAHSSGVTHIITGDLQWGKNDNIFGVNFIDNESHDGCVYRNGKWAEIISKPGQQFIEGKWYKVNTHKLNYKKFLNLDEENKKFYYSEEIYDFTDSIRHRIHNDWIDINFNFILLTDLNEIQQYLPDGHIDKIQTNIMEEKKYNYEVVHCETQEQWDFITKILNYKWSVATWNHNKKNSCINIFEQSHSRLGYYQESNAKIYSFQEWCKEFNHTPDFIKPIKEWSVGSYAVALKDNAYDIGESIKGDIFIKIDENNKYWAFYNNKSNNGWDCESEQDFKWFPTLQETEIFSRSLLDKSEIPEYVKCISYFDNIKTNKIYNTKKDTPENLGISWEDILIDCSRLKDGSFVESDREAYENQFKQYPLTPKECNMQDIEIGDEVEITNSYDTWKIGLKGILLKDDYNNDIRYQIDTKSSYGIIWCRNVKLIKKASQTAIAKKVDVSSPKVGNKLLLFKKRESITLPNVERTKLKIFKQKLIKI